MLAAAAASVTVPDLSPQSDSGWSSTDNVTSVATPVFVGSASGATTVQISDGSQLLGSADVAGGKWTFVIAASSPLAPGRHSIIAQGFGADGKAGPKSRPLGVQIVTAAPPPPTIALDPASNSGDKTDGTTNVARPTFVGTAAVGTRLFLRIDDGPEQMLTPNARGRWALSAPFSLADGAHTVTVQAVNVAGLRSGIALLSLTIDTVSPTMSIEYLPADNAVAVTFTRPVTGISLAAFNVKGTLFGLSFNRALTDPLVKQATGVLVLVPKPGAPAGTAYLLKKPSSDIFGFPAAFTISLARTAGIVETESGAANPLVPTNASCVVS